MSLSSSRNSEIVNPNENLQIPAWIKADYFKDILAKDEPEFKKVIKFTPTAAIPPGENYTSIMLRIHMELEMKDGSTKLKTYVLKTMLDNDKGGDVISALSLFPKEMEMYEKYLPAFEALYKAAGNEKEIQLAPKCLWTEQKDDRINFVFEDLKAKNFQNVDRLNGFDMAHMRRVLEKLAEFHAASAVYEEQNGPYPKVFHQGFVNENGDVEQQRSIYNQKIVEFSKAMFMWGLEGVDKYIQKLPTFEQYWKCGLRANQFDSKAFNVLSHCDFWSSNIMMNYHSDGGIDELLLVDFQICKWGSPAVDLLFLLTISPSNEIRIKEFDHFIEIYYERLTECLKVLKYKRPLPKLRDLHMDMYKENTSFYAFFAVFNHLSVILLETDKDSNIHTLRRTDKIGEEFRMRIYTNPRFVAAVNDLFPFYHRRGIFNFQDYD